MSGRPLFTVIVPTRGRADLAATCVRAVLAQADAPAFELLLADQSDGTATRDAAAVAAGGDARYRHVAVTGRGRSRALNEALPAARGSWIVMTDDDCRPASDWLAALERAVAGVGGRSIVVGRVLPGPAEPGKGDPPAILDEPTPRTIAGKVDRDWIYPNVAVPRALFDEVGHFDERLGIGTSLPGGEDNDFGYRLLRAGWTIAYRPEPRVWHAAWRSVAERAALKHAYGLGQGGFYAKHLASGDFFVAWRLVKDLGRSARAASGAALRGRLAEGRGHAAYFRGIVRGCVRMARTLGRKPSTGAAR